MELSGRLQELQNEVNFMNDSKDFMDAESNCSGNPHVTSPPGLFPRHPPFEGMLKPAFISQRQDEEPPNIWDTSGISGNVFAHPQVSSSAPYPQELNSSKWNTWKKTTEEPIHKSIAEKSGRPERDSDLRCQSGPSAKNSVLFSGGDSSKNYGADQQRLQISDLHFDKFPTPATFACWKIRFKTEVCTCSQFPTEAMQWIKEVELVDSVDDLRSSSSIRLRRTAAESGRLSVRSRAGKSAEERIAPAVMLEILAGTKNETAAEVAAEVVSNATRNGQRVLYAVLAAKTAGRAN